MPCVLTTAIDLIQLSIRKKIKTDKKIPNHTHNCINSGIFHSLKIYMHVLSDKL